MGWTALAYRQGILGVKRSLRIQLILTFVICLTIGFLAAALTSLATEAWFRDSMVNYSSGRYNIDNVARSLAQTITLQTSEGPVDIQHEIQQQEENNRHTKAIGDLRILVVDSKGQVLYKSSKVKDSEINLHDALWKSMEQQNNYVDSSEEGAMFAYPVEVQGTHAFVIASGVPKATIMYRPNGNPIPTIVFFVVFFVAFYGMTKRKIRHIKQLADGVQLISEGNLQHRVPARSLDELGALAKSINHMAQELHTTIEAERHAEKAKNELITNVSHDLRTPLTSVMGYLRLLHEHRDETPEQREEYVRIAYGKSEQLQGLVEDLFEFTKLMGQEVRLGAEEVCLQELLGQIVEEMVPLFDEAGLSVQLELPEARLYLAVDAEKLVRVVENLLSNAIKYSIKPSAVLVKLIGSRVGVEIVVENRGKPISPEELSRLFERFYRVEQSRSSEHGGSGLGLAIAKSIVELHQGKIWAECEGECIRFHVWLPRTQRDAKSMS